MTRPVAMSAEPHLDELPATTSAGLEAALAGAAAAVEPLDAFGRNGRAFLLGKIATALDRAMGDLVPLAERETHLPEARLIGELRRTTFQLRLIAEIATAGEFVDAMIDHADDEWPIGPRPDIRRMLVPIGPALVFAASNFPFAFGVVGGDTASALAAGCPVILKGHPGHPELSRLLAQLIRDVVVEVGAPNGTFTLISGLEAGRQAIVDHRVKVASFTGSLAAGRALFDLACSRPDPIPFYGELGSLNPVFVTRKALENRRDEILTGYVESFTLGVGQFCTKPGLLFVPEDADVLAPLEEMCRARTLGQMLNARLSASYQQAVQRLAENENVSVRVTPSALGASAAAPHLLATTVPALLSHPERILFECFGPSSVVVQYTNECDLPRIVSALPGQLTATLQAEEDDHIAPALLAALTKVAGRVIWNGWPTGVSVTWAMHHGGPYPSTTAVLHTSVGGAALARFLRPVAFQGVPDDHLPPELREENPLRIPRRVDGTTLSRGLSGKR